MLVFKVYHNLKISRVTSKQLNEGGQVLMNCKFFVENESVISRSYAKKIQKELSVSASVSTKTLENNPGESFFAGLKRIVKEEILQGNGHKKLFTLIITAEDQRKIEIEIPIMKNPQGGAYGGVMYYSTFLPIKLQGKGILFSTVQFNSLSDQQDENLVRALNQDTDIKNFIISLTKKQTQVAGYNLSIPRYCEITPSETGSLLKIAILPVMKMFGFSCRLMAQEFITIASMIEKRLQTQQK